MCCERYYGGMTDNASIGLPYAPTGHVWHITPSQSGISVWVHLVRGEDFVWSEHAAPDAESVRQAAEWCLYHYWNERDKREKVKALCGTYPPMKLEGAK